MEKLATGLLEEINKICIEYYYFNKTDGIKRIQSIQPQIMEYLEVLIQTLQKNADDEDTVNICNYINGVLEDYFEAVKNDDIVLMIDTVDHGLREVLELCIGEAD